MLSGMSTIEIIENLNIEKLTENRVIRRFGWLPTNCISHYKGNCMDKLRKRLLCVPSMATPPVKCIEGKGVPHVPHEYLKAARATQPSIAASISVWSVYSRAAFKYSWGTRVHVLIGQECYSLPLDMAMMCIIIESGLHMWCDNVHAWSMDLGLVCAWRLCLFSKCVCNIHHSRTVTELTYIKTPWVSIPGGGGVACIITPPPILQGWMSYYTNIIIWSTNKNNERNSRFGMKICKIFARSHI